MQLEIIKIRKDHSGEIHGIYQLIRYIGSPRGYKRHYYLCKCSKCNNESEIWLDSKLSERQRCSKCPIICGKDHYAWKGCGDLSKNYWNAVKHSAKARDLEFDVSLEYLWDLFLRQKGKCALSGLDIQFDTGSQSDKNQTASLDRIDSSKGYIKDNVQWIHSTINNIKCDMSNQPFIFMCNSIASQNHKLTKNSVKQFTDYTIKTVRNPERCKQNKYKTG